MMMKTALMIIDVQNDMFAEGNPVFNGKKLIKNIQMLLEEARSKGVPVFFVQHEEGKGTPMEYGTKGWEIHPDIEPLLEETIIHKKTPDSFYETTLEENLKKQGINHLILAGIQTDVCVDTTCRRAFSMGYKVTLVSDTHSTWGTKELSSEQIIHHHNQLLRWFADVKPMSEITFH